MSHQIIKQPNNKYAVWSTIVDNFIMVNATSQEIIDYYVGAKQDRIKMEVQEKIDKINKGEKPYYQFTLSFDEALEVIKFCHGEKERQDILKLVEKDS